MHVLQPLILRKSCMLEHPAANCRRNQPSKVPARPTTKTHGQMLGPIDGATLSPHALHMSVDPCPKYQKTTSRSTLTGVGLVVSGVVRYGPTTSRRMTWCFRTRSWSQNWAKWPMATAIPSHRVQEASLKATEPGPIVNLVPQALVLFPGGARAHEGPSPSSCPFQPQNISQHLGT
jgi:hypothetical protein